MGPRLCTVTTRQICVMSIYCVYIENLNEAVSDAQDLANFEDNSVKSVAMQFMHLTHLGMVLRYSLS